MEGNRVKTDILIIGSGLSGLFLAKKLSDMHAGQVLIITKKLKTDSNSANAQGGIAVVLSGDDSLEKHVQDTLVAGDGLCNETAVRTITSNGPRCVKELIDIGVPFTRDDEGRFDLGKEGGHSQRRVIHAGDLTGNEVQRTLLDVVERECPDVHIRENLIAVNLLVESGTCIGLHALDEKTGNVISISAKYTILATGGAGKVYLYTSNPDIATGDGISMAYRAGARIANMEFFQFHPTCLFHPRAKSFLISEALRGEGAVLMNHRGERFTFKYHERGELAPRDIVSRAIDQEMKEHGLDCVYLDISFKGKEFITNRFPNIYKRCLEFGFDITEQPVPVVPAAHFTCGGVMANVNGTTHVNGLYAIGEVACTGFHGANRLASNSLLECVVCADFTAKHIKESVDTAPLPFKQVRNWDPGKAIESREEIVVKHNWDEVRTLMWNYVGIVRTVKSMARARSRLEIIMNEIRDYYWQYLLTADLVELRHIVQVAELIVQSAMARQESRGTHYIIDFPSKLPHAIDTVIQRTD